MSKFLRIKGLCKSFQSGSEKLQILMDLALEVEQGEMVAVTGASGSGKSTFLHLVGGMERADAGEIRLEGTDVNELEGSKLAGFRSQKIGFIFQFHHLLPEFSALENVMFPLLLRGQTFGQSSREAKSLNDGAALPVGPVDVEAHHGVRRGFGTRRAATFIGTVLGWLSGRYAEDRLR